MQPPGGGLAMGAALLPPRAAAKRLNGRVGCAK